MLANLWQLSQSFSAVLNVCYDIWDYYEIVAKEAPADDVCN